MTTSTAWADRSEQIDLISAALVQALGEMTDLPKTQTANTGKFSYTYATLASVIQMARPILLKHGLAMTQTATAEGDDVMVITTLLHNSGQFLASHPLAMPIGQTAQATGSSITFGRRYALLAILGLATEDDDGASATARTRGRSEAAQRPVETRKPPAEVPEPRTPEEAKIRHLLGAIPAAEAKSLKADFIDTFGASLADLDPSLHASALVWVETSIGWDAQ